MSSLTLGLRLDPGWLAGLGLLGAACGPLPPPEGDSDGSSTGSTTAATSTTSIATSTTSTASTASTTSTTEPPRCVPGDPCDVCATCDEFGHCIPDPVCCGDYTAPDGARVWRCSPPLECLFDSDCPDDYYCDGIYCRPDPPPPSLPLCDQGPVELSQWDLSQTPSSLGLADLDGDGDLDLFAGLPLGARIELAFNDGSGALSPGGLVDLAPAPSVGQVAAGDLDGDGDADLVAELPESAEYVLLFGQGGTFTPGPTLKTTAPPAESVQVIDVEGDGDLDLVAVDDPGDVLTRLGDGLGGFGPEQIAGFAASNWVHVADANDDGFVDLLADEQALSVYAGSAPPATWTLATQRDVGSLPWRHAFAARLGGPGRALIRVRDKDFGGRVRLWRGTGPGSWDLVASDLATTERLIGGTTADVDGDGFEDVVAVTDGLRVSVLLADGLGGFACEDSIAVLAITDPKRLAVGDLDGDGHTDIVTGSPDAATVTILRGL